MTTLSILLGASIYEVRHMGSVIVDATEISTGRDVDPEDLRALAVRLGRMEELQRRLDAGADALDEEIRDEIHAAHRPPRQCLGGPPKWTGRRRP